MTNIAKVMQNQPGSKVFQIIDSHWPEQYPMLEMVMQNIRSYGDGEGFSAQADTLEELASQLELSADATQNLSAAVARYNELCEKGVDEDFGKAAEKMFPVVDPPFYAITYDMLKHTSVEDVSCMRLLVTMGGLVTDDNARVLKDPEPLVLFLSFGASTLDHELRIHVRELGDRNLATDEINRRIDELFKEHGIEIAFNQIDVHVRSIDGKEARLETISRNVVASAHQPASDGSPPPR